MELIKPIKYYTKTHPLYRCGIEINFFVNGLPYLKVGDIIQVFSISRFFEWIHKGYISNAKENIITIDAIKKAVCSHEMIHTDIVFNKTRKREVLQARQIIQYFAKDFNLGSLSTIGQNTGGKDHATILHSHKTILGYLDVYPEWRQKIYDIKEKLI